MLASLIRRAIGKFDFKRRENSIFRTFSEVNKPLATDLFAFVIICCKLDLSRWQLSKQFYVLFARTKRNMSYANPKENHFQFPKG